MGVRDRLGRAGCALGLHGGAWAWVADASCEQANTCPRCGKAASRTEHDLTDWSYADPGDTGSCLMERRCRRCRRAETAVRHEPRWRYESDSRCEGRLACERCGAPCGEPGTRHQWGPWLPDRDAVSLPSPLSLRSSRLARSCQRCAGREQMT